MINNLLKINPSVDVGDELKFFLAESKIVDVRGNVYSWLNARNPGFVYPEIMGLYLNLSSQLISLQKFEKIQQQDSGGNDWLALENDLPLMSLDQKLESRTHAIAQQLQRLVPASGGLGKAGKIYAFDNCMVISGLLTYRKYLTGYVDDNILSRLADFTVKSLKQRLTYIATDGDYSKPTPHWSNTFGASMLKNVIALCTLTEETQNPLYYELALEIAAEIIDSCFHNGYFKAFATTDTVYCHAHCYALEGLLYLQTKGYQNFSDVLIAGVEQLKAWQNDDGSLYNWYNIPARQRFKVADATAQAIRLWLAIDSDGYQENIQKAWQFLDSLRSPQKGLYYRVGSQDCNSWASIFALQAADWYANGVHGDRLV